MKLSADQERALEGARAMFRERLGDRLEDVKAAVDRAAGGDGERYDAYRLAHSLAGTTATLGFTHLTPALRILEETLEVETPDWLEARACIDRVIALHRDPS
ncbi:MAG: Hpt domain-containing protein [Myxococcota bacterium]